MEEEKISAPAILIFKGLSELTVNFTIEDKASLLDAICNYADGKELPSMSPIVEIVFKVVKRDIDKNEEKYAKKCAHNKKVYEKRKSEREKARENEKAEESQQTKPRERQKPIRAPVELTKEQESFLKSFKEHLPNKIIDCQITDFPNIDYNALMLEIKRSPQFLMDDEKSKSFNLRWYLEHAEKIIAGNYKEFGDKVKSNFSTKHDYTKEEMNSLYQRIEDIEV